MMKSYYLLILFGVFFSCQNKPDVQSSYFEGEALGTTYHITVFNDVNGKIVTKKDIDSVITAVNNSLSTYQSNSLISMINSGKIVKVDSQFVDVYNAAQQIYVETGGMYDPTIGILVNAWGFGPKNKIQNIENSPKIVDSLKKYVDYNYVKIDSDGFLLKRYPQVYIDYNSIAKGYAIDRVGQMLERKGVHNYLVEIGGEVLTKGKNLKKNRKWYVAIDNPDRESKKKFISKLALSNQAMATSGNYRKYYIDKKTGKKYVHTLNPKTGYPIQSNLLSASVVAGNCTMADGYATALMVMGYEKSKQFLKKHPELQAFLVYSDDAGKIHTFHTFSLEILR